MALQRLLFSALFLQFAVDCVTCISLSDLMPYGAPLDYKLDNETDDFNSVEVQLTTPIVFYEQSYSSVYVGSARFSNLIALFLSFTSRRVCKCCHVLSIIIVAIIIKLIVKVTTQARVCYLRHESV